MNKAEIFSFLASIKPHEYVSLFDFEDTLQEQFGLSQQEANAVICEYLRTFSERFLRDKELVK